MNGATFKKGVAVGVVFGGVAGMSVGVGVAAVGGVVSVGGVVAGAGGIVAVVGVVGVGVAAVGGRVAEAEKLGFFVGGGVGCMVSAAFLATSAS